jgi:uncharacterized repeat protein (TIGR01451 family)
MILAGTAWIVWLYTKAAQKTNEIQEQPVLNLSLIKGNYGDNIWYTLEVKNVGRAPAYNVIFFPLVADEYIYHPFLGDDANPVFETGTVKPLYFWIKKEPNITEHYDKQWGFDTFLKRFFPQNTDPQKYEELKRTSVIFILNYEGVNGKKYHSVFRVYSKIWAILGAYDLVSEFISTGEGLCTMENAKKICEQKQTLSKFQK